MPKCVTPGLRSSAGPAQPMSWRREEILRIPGVGGAATFPCTPRLSRVRPKCRKTRGPETIQRKLIECRIRPVSLDWNLPRALPQPMFPEGTRHKRTRRSKNPRHEAAPSIHLTTVTQGAAPAAEQAIGPTIERSISPGTEVEELLRHQNHSPPRPNFHIEILMPMIKKWTMYQATNDRKRRIAPTSTNQKCANDLPVYKLTPPLKQVRWLMINGTASTILQGVAPKQSNNNSKVVRAFVLCTRRG